MRLAHDLTPPLVHGSLQHQQQRVIRQSSLTTRSFKAKTLRASALPYRPTSPPSKLPFIISKSLALKATVCRFDLLSSGFVDTNFIATTAKQYRKW
jgi:hypothetical protein